MKLERNSIVAIAVGVTFAILLLFNLFNSGFIIEIKGILVSVYFAIWVGALGYVILTFIIPFVQERKKAGRGSKPGAGTGPGATPAPFKSPRSGMPVRERIAAYVTERRREDGLPSPEPLRPSRTGSSAPASAGRSAPSVSSVRAAEPSIAAPPVMAASGSDMGDLPLPDDFGSVDEPSDDMGALPGLDDDFGGMDEFGGSDDMPPDFGDDNSGLLGADDIGSPVSSDSSLPADDLPDGGLPGFDGDLDSDIGESDIMGDDDSMMDLSGDDVLTMDDEGPSSMSDGGLSEAGLPDLDDTLEPDMMDTDLGSDEDFGDIEFVDLEPDEPKPPKK